MGYRVDIYEDGTATAISDTPAVGIKVYVPGMQVVQSRPITEAHFKQLRSQQEAAPGNHLTFDAKTGQLTVKPLGK